MSKNRTRQRGSGRAGWFALATILLLSSAAQGMYDPHHGRWFQRDPLGVRPDALATIEPHNQYSDSVNLYEYVRSLPQCHTDPDGKAIPLPVAVPVVVAAACAAPVVLEMHYQQRRTWSNDKYAHCVTSCRLSKVCGRQFAAAGGWTKELRDEIEKRLGLGDEDIGWDVTDEAANLTGRRCAGRATLIPVPVALMINAILKESCHCCCSRCGYKPFGKG